MLVPASQGENAAVEYALNGVASFVTAAGREQLRPAVCEGLLAALARCKDDANRAFLVSQLQLCATADNAAALAAYIDDPYLGDPVLRALISIPDSEATLLSLARRSDLSDAQRAALAYAFGEKRTAAAEPILLGWIDGADDATRAALYPALASCGTAASAKALEAAARAVDYGCDETAATDSYLRLLDRMVDEGAARDAVKAAKRLLKCERANVRGAALEVIVRAEGTRAMPYVLAALEKGDIQYRNAALRYIGDKADDAVYAAIAADRKRLSDEAWADVIEWFGVRHAASQTGAVTEAVGSSNDAVALAGIRAAGRLGGDEALAALIAALGGPHSDAAAQTLLAFNGRIDEGVVKALDGRGTMQVQALNLAAARRIDAVADKVFALLDAPDAAVSEAAYRALASIAAPADVDRLSRLLDTADAAHAGQLSAALTHAVRTLAPEKQYETVYARMSASPRPERYYPTLAQTGTQQAIDCLVENFAGSRRAEAFDALLRVEAPQIAGVLYTIAAGNPDLADRALTRYTACVAALDATPVFELSPEERAEGYEVLFDGRSLHKWTGNTTNYVPQEGTIYVTASYGGKGNLYTVEEYGDFILRFEFRFLREGVNNGIGLRTPMGVDAAYHGMEIQILDHDAPIYKNLRVYQQHGSVYGIIPAKRIKFGELGTWNVEEIRAVGDRITVTVNGEVILDGDIREACQGHNVSEDGSKKNPYTVDHRNHPGLFNKKGHIGLLGHGAGIQFRNIRIKSLDAKTQNGK